ncbi:hypothetical protein [uncultured Croceitalea sp.]|uniref:hypothetical protein n=1 Tax=uncultured Croceitalea sp. TaxID=1798908 RepID=UPI0033064FA3
MKKTIITFLFTFLIFTLNAQINDDNNIVYQTDANGKGTNGSIGALTKAIQSGKQIRVGFSMGPVEHWTDAGFLTIFEGEVFAQIEGIFQQAPNVLNEENKIPKIDFASKKDNSWSAIIGTTGVMKMHWDFNKETLLKHLKTKEKVDEYLKSLASAKVATKWAAY